jgi:hypothetical protein
MPQSNRLIRQRVAHCSVWVRVAASADFGAQPGSEAGEKNGQERAKWVPDGQDGPTKEVRRSPREHQKGARRRANRERLALGYWWSRGESNPRPQAINGQFYMLSWLI